MQEQIKFVKERIEERMRGRNGDAYISALLLNLIEEIVRLLPKTND